MLEKNNSCGNKWLNESKERANTQEERPGPTEEVDPLSQLEKSTERPRRREQRKK